jgi:hypothetical protein
MDPAGATDYVPVGTGYRGTRAGTGRAARPRQCAGETPNGIPLAQPSRVQPLALSVPSHTVRVCLRSLSPRSEDDATCDLSRNVSSNRRHREEALLAIQVDLDWDQPARSSASVFLVDRATALRGRATPTASVHKDDGYPDQNDEDPGACRHGAKRRSRRPWLHRSVRAWNDARTPFRRQTTCAHRYTRFAQRRPSWLPHTRGRYLRQATPVRQSCQRVHREDRIYRAFQADSSGTGRPPRVGPGRQARTSQQRRQVGQSRSSKETFAKRKRTQGRTTTAGTAESSVQWRSDAGWVRRTPAGTWVPARPSARVASRAAKRKTYGRPTAKAATARPSQPVGSKPKPKPKIKRDTARRHCGVGDRAHLPGAPWFDR